jgi:hypothetical protein
MDGKTQKTDTGQKLVTFMVTPPNKDSLLWQHFHLRKVQIRPYKYEKDWALERGKEVWTKYYNGLAFCNYCAPYQEGEDDDPVGICTYNHSMMFRHLREHHPDIDSEILVKTSPFSKGFPISEFRGQFHLRSSAPNLLFCNHCCKNRKVEPDSQPNFTGKVIKKAPPGVFTLQDLRGLPPGQQMEKEKELASMLGRHLTGHCRSRVRQRYPVTNMVYGQWFQETGPPRPPP